MRVFVLLGCLIGRMTAVAAGLELDSVYPAGGHPDSAFEIEVGGTLENITQGVFSGEGIKAVPLGPVKEAANTKKGKAGLKPVRNRFRFSVTIEKDALTGIRQFRIGTAGRLSEPLRFEVSDMPEVSEAPTNRAAVTETVLGALPVCLNGRIRGAETDRYRFRAAKGASVVAFTEERVLPRERFRPVLSFTDASDKPCEGVCAYDAATAPVAVLIVPQDGTYALTVTRATDKGGNDGVYRIKLGTGPLITGFSPRGAKAGESVNVRLSGYNLAQERVRLFTGGKNSALCLEALTKDALVLPGLRFDLSDEADVDETEPNNSVETAQVLEPPCVVNGDLDVQGGRDVYRFSGKKGEALVVDVRAAALGSPLKASVTVRDARGAAVAGGRFDTNATVRAAVCGSDPSVAVTLPEDGAYAVEVADLEGRSGSEFVYRLCIGPPQPDFELWMTPASLNIPADGSELVALHLNRLHGFDGEVRVTLDYPPLSIACEGGLIPAGATVGKMTVSTDGARYPRTVFGLSLTGAAQIGTRVVRHPAVPIVFRQGLDGAMRRCACDELSAKVGVGANALRIDPLGKGTADARTPAPTAFKQPVTVDFKEPVRLTVLSVALATNLGGLYVPTVVWPPQGFTVAAVQPTNKQERAGVLLKADASVMRSGQTGYFILGCYKKDSTNRTVTATTQSVPFVIR